MICRRVLDPRGNRGYGWCAAALVLLLLMMSSTARVHAQGRDSAEYQAAIAEAVSEFQAGNWEEAQALFREAHRLSPNARTLRGLGIVAFELRRYVDAIGFLRQALEDSRKPLSAEQRKATTEQIVRAERFIARFELELSPEGTRLAVDGVARELREGQLWLDPGEREITASAEGYRSESRRIVVEGGTRGRLSFQLRASGEAVADAPLSTPVPDRATPEPAVAGDGGGIPTGAVIVGSVGLAMLAGSAVTGFLALGAKGELEDACGTRKSACDEKNESTADEAATLALTTDVLWIGGAAVVTSALVWALLAGGDEPAPSVGVAIGPRDVALGFRQRF